MRLTAATITTGRPHSEAMGREILESLPRDAVGYNYALWPRIVIIYQYPTEERDRKVARS